MHGLTLHALVGVERLAGLCIRGFVPFSPQLLPLHDDVAGGDGIVTLMMISLQFTLIAAFQRRNMKIDATGTWQCSAVGAIHTCSCMAPSRNSFISLQVLMLSGISILFLCALASRDPFLELRVHG